MGRFPAKIGEILTQINKTYYSIPQIKKISHAITRGDKSAHATVAECPVFDAFDSQLFTCTAEPA